MNKFLMVLPLALIVGCASKPQIVEVEVPAKPKQVAEAEVPVKQKPIEIQIQQPAWVQAPSNNPSVVSGFKDVEYMQRNEVIQATKDCVDNRMKPVIQYVPQKTTHGTLMLPAMVTCEVIPGYTVSDAKSVKESETKPVEVVVKQSNTSNRPTVTLDRDEYLRWARSIPGGQ